MDTYLVKSESVDLSMCKQVSDRLGCVSLNQLKLTPGINATSCRHKKVHLSSRFVHVGIG